MFASSCLYNNEQIDSRCCPNSKLSCPPACLYYFGYLFLLCRPPFLFNSIPFYVFLSWKLKHIDERSSKELVLSFLLCIHQQSILRANKIWTAPPENITGSHTQRGREWEGRRDAHRKSLGNGQTKTFCCIIGYNRLLINVSIQHSLGTWKVFPFFLFLFRRFHLFFWVWCVRSDLLNLVRLASDVWPHWPVINLNKAVSRSSSSIKRQPNPTQRT